MTQQDIHSGFVLSKSAFDVDNKLHIVLWVKTASSITKLLIEDELTLLFVEIEALGNALTLLRTNRIPSAQHKVLDLKTFNQQQVAGIYFYSLNDFYQARELLKSNSIKCYEDDIRPEERFLMERFITADIDFTGHVYAKDNYLSYSQVKCKKAKKSDKTILTMLSIDIECSMEGELFSIGMFSLASQHNAINHCDYQKVFMIGQPQECDEQYIVWVKDEKVLLQHFINEVRSFDPDIIIGWNVINFDFRLLQKRCDYHDLLFVIGRDNTKVRWRSQNNEQYYIYIAGRVVLDGIDLLKTATYSFPSFSLDFVANSLLGLSKKVNDVDNRVQEIINNFRHDKIALAQYNLEDCRLVSLIFSQEQLLAFAILRAQLTGLSIDRVGGSVAAFTNLYLPKLHRSGYIAPNMGDGDSELVSPGGYVMDSIPGLYNNVLVLDFKSLYPSIIRTFNIDPMGLIEGLLEHKENAQKTVGHQAIPAYDGAYFSRQKHFLPDIITSLWDERDKAKKERNTILSQAIKIIMNSFYGVLGSTGCRFFDPRLSGAITKRGHDILKTTKQWIHDKGYQVIYGDTDSIFVHVKDGEENQIMSLGTELQHYINHKWQHHIKEVYQLDCELEIEFETHFSKFLMPTIRGSELGTKKRYAGMITNENGQSHIVFKGLESVRTDWTQLAKEFQQTLYHKVFNDEDVDEYIRDTVRKTLSGQYDDKLVYRKRIRRKLSSYVKNVPPHVKAARLADKYNAELGKPLKYQGKGWIEYFITLNGPQVKEQLESTIDYQFYIDRQLCAVADAILPFINKNFNDITTNQLGLF